MRPGRCHSCSQSGADNLSINSWLRRRVRRTFVIGLGLGLAVQPGQAAAVDEPNRAAAVAALHERFPERFIDPQTLVFADFDGDGRADFAAFLGDPMSNQPDRVLRAVMFRATALGGFEFQGSTLDLPSGGNVTQVLAVKGGILSIDRGGSQGCCAVWRELLKFGWRGGRLRLVGVDESILASGDTPDDRGRSVNTITGDVVGWSLKDHHRTEVRSRLAPRLAEFAGFDYDDVMARLGTWP